MKFGVRFTEMFGVRWPIIQAPMAGSSNTELAIAVSEAGGLGSLPCAMLSPDQVGASVGVIRQRTTRPINLNFFCHPSPAPDSVRDREWRDRLASYYRELGIDLAAVPSGPARRPFDDAMCDAVVEVKPEVVSFHFGLPPKALLDRIRGTGAQIG